MISTIFSAFIITIILAFIIENLKLNLQIKQISKINNLIDETIQDFLYDKKSFDIFIINDLRKVFEKEFLEKRIIDNYELFREDENRIIIIYNRGKIFQELEVVNENGSVVLNEIKINYGNNY